MTIEVLMIGLAIWVQAAYFAVGLLMIGLAGLLQWAESREPAHETGVVNDRRRHHVAA